MGNIQSLKRYGMIPAGRCFDPGLIDDLAYTYGGQGRLTHVEDSAPTTYRDYGFKPGDIGDGRTGGPDHYEYDANGNLIADHHKDLTCQYNYLNLPELIQATGGQIELVYDASGRKLIKRGPDGDREYILGIEYIDGKLESIAAPDGRLVAEYDATTGTILQGYRPEYWRKDHLGNTRLAFSDTDAPIGVITFRPGQPLEITQEAHYYPFGMGQVGDWYEAVAPENRYTYNGKELNTELGLEWLDYGARWYDAAIERWNGVDPMAEKYAAWSTYTYALDNPIRFIDPNGREVIAPNEASRELVLQSVTYMFGKNHGFSFDGNKLIHSGAIPEGLSEGQSLMFSYFNDALVNSDTKTTVRANSRTGSMETGADVPSLVSVKKSSAATTFGVGSFVKKAGIEDFQVPVRFDAQNLILVPSETVANGTNVMTKGGSRKVGADHILSHEFGHAIVNTIMNEFGGQFNGVDFNAMTKGERSDWAIRFTNTLFKGSKQETGEGQHGRDNSTRPTHTLDPLKN